MRLKAENRKLRDPLALALGDEWQADLAATLREDPQLDAPRGRKKL